MRGSIRLGSLFGIPVYLHFTFLLLLGVIAVTQGSLSAALGGVVFVGAIFGCVVLHEFGHALAARRFGIETRDVTLLPIGGVARLERMPDDPRQEFWVAVAGPAVNVAIAGLLGILLFLTGSGYAGGVGMGGGFVERLVAINVGLVLFNMLPAFPMDGGRVLRSLLAGRMSYVRATDLAASIGKGMALLFGVVGLFWNPMLIVIALFVWFGAGQEAATVRSRAAFGRSPSFAVYPAQQQDDVTLEWDGRGYARPSEQRRTYRIGPWLVVEERTGGDRSP